VLKIENYEIGKAKDLSAPLRIMKADRSMEVKFHAFLISAIGENLVRFAHTVLYRHRF
jgi:hypothetical protein